MSPPYFAYLFAFLYIEFYESAETTDETGDFSAEPAANRIF
jgi:hypothetical protein